MRNTPVPIIKIIKKNVIDGLSMPNMNPLSNMETGADDLTMV